MGVDGVEWKLDGFELNLNGIGVDLNCIWMAFELSFKQENKVDSFLLYLDFILHYEKIFSLFQCTKVLDYMGLTYENLLSGK